MFLQHQHNASVVPPLTSLDLLHSSPFKGGSAALSSLADSEFRASSAMYNHPSGLGTAAALSLTQNSNDSHYHFHHHDGPDHDDYDNDMPFAVEADIAATGGNSAFASASATTVPLPVKKLQLFEESKTEVQSLTEQLQDFQAFGASLHQ